VPGATIGTLSALAVARERAGERPTSGWSLAATGEAHASVRSAARVLDVGFVDVPGDERGRLTGPALADALEGRDDVFAVVASAGTTNAGVVDDLAGVAEVCTERGVWLHIDAAYGGAALAAPSARSRLAGIERSDSFVIDPHKWLFANYDCAALVYRDPVHAAAALSQHADYLDTVDRQEWNPSDYAVHLTRRARGLPFWFSLAVHGTAAYAEAVEASLDLARRVAGQVRERPKLELLMEPDLSIVVLRRPGWTAEDYDRWSHLHAKAGSWLVVPTRWRGEAALRLCFLHPKTRERDIEHLLDSLEVDPP
jgi:glutamate/tyrosine decarboxylase-like PLP-dependent enzyme